MQKNTVQSQSSQGYQDFLATKRVIAPSSGIAFALVDIHPMLFEFQRALDEREVAVAA